MLKGDFHRGETDARSWKGTLIFTTDGTGWHGWGRTCRAGVVFGVEDENEEEDDANDNIGGEKVGIEGRPCLDFFGLWTSGFGWCGKGNGRGGEM